MTVFMKRISGIILSRRIIDFIISYHPRTVAIIAVLASFFLPLTLQAYEFQTCKNCHKVTLDEDNSKNYLHSPFSAGECEECHVGQVVDSQIDWRKVRWLAETRVCDTYHAFLLPDDQLRDTFAVKLYGNTGEISRQVMALPPRFDLPEVEDSGKPPVISNIQVLEVKRGVLISATVGWETDTLADAAVRYSNEDFVQTVKPNNRLARKHQRVLSKLKPDSTYSFSVISQDVFGRSQVSEPLTFSTAEFFSTMQQPDNSGNVPEKENESLLATRFRRLGSDYLIELTLKQPASIRIGTIGESRCLPDDEDHAGLSCRKAYFIETCLNCHSAHDHPVNVSPRKPGIIIPPEFPSLQGGRIVCISCHESHSSEYASLTRKDLRGGLCESCHQNK